MEQVLLEDLEELQDQIQFFQQLQQQVVEVVQVSVYQDLVGVQEVEVEILVQHHFLQLDQVILHPLAHHKEIQVEMQFILVEVAKQVVEVEELLLQEEMHLVEQLQGQEGQDQQIQ